MPSRAASRLDSTRIWPKHNDDLALGNGGIGKESIVVEQVRPGNHWKIGPIFRGGGRGRRAAPCRRLHARDGVLLQAGIVEARVGAVSRRRDTAAGETAAREAVHGAQAAQRRRLWRRAGRQAAGGGRAPHGAPQARCRRTWSARPSTCAAASSSRAAANPASAAGRMASTDTRVEALAAGGCWGGADRADKEAPGQNSVEE